MTPRVLKKYPNRRLYDTEKSRYVTLADVRELVLVRTEFVVIDKKSGDDITRAILLQVSIEQEQQGEPIMSQDFLSHVIRSHDRIAPGSLASHLEQTLGQALARPPKARGEGLPPPRIVGIGSRTKTG